MAVWRVVVKSPDAVQTSLQFADVDLPSGAVLWVYDPRREVVQGPYTRADVASGGDLWAALVPGDTAVVEVDVPQARASDVRLRLAEVHHAFAAFWSNMQPDAVAAKAGGSAGGCEIDLTCPAGNTWRDDARAVAMISIGGNFQCTATLLNDVPGDGTPYMLTAKHCGIGTAGNPASSVTVYWNYQNSICGGSDASLAQSQTGATLLVSGAQSDVTLIRLNQTPPAAFDVRFAGWDARGVIPQDGATVHHPQDDAAKISLFSTPAQAQNISLSSGGVNTSTAVWGVFWSQGVTEDGSSGAPLFDGNHRVVGQLSGGSSNCANLAGEDFFGRLDVSWNTTTPPLAQFLDPDASGRQFADARDANASPPPVQPGPPPATGGTAGPSAGRSGGGAGDLLLLLGLAAVGLFRRLGKL
ncbi:MAG: hypothetical protein EPN72_10625 [Nevskiaceae bacterium]|nr:MAG: hypothetical protein EPN63_05635 [Nevskiaceae bacterium]TBR72204.1 MAG: hypothetical protein EPN72_10625 [Nevskiaceae bacterium]